MESKAVARRVKIETKQDIGEVESKQATSAKAPASGDHGSVGIEVKHDMSATVADTQADLFLDQLQVDVTGTVVVMICCKWDVNAVTGRYLSTDFVVSDAKNDGYMIEFDGATSIRKAFVKADGFVRYPFQLVDFDGIEPTDSNYLINVVGYITNVGRTNHQKTSSRNLDFYLANHMGQSIRVTPWGALGDVLIEKKAKQAGMCPIVLTSANAKYYNMKALITNMPASGEDSKKLSVPIDHSAPREGTLENLLILQSSTVRYRLELGITDDTANIVVVMFDEPATTLVGCSAESVMEDDDESLNYQSNLAPALANLIGTTHTLEIKSHTYYEYGTFESFTCWTIFPTEEVVETASSSTLDAEAATESLKLKSLTQDPSIPTPSKPSEERQTQRVVIEDSDSEDKGDTAMHVVDKKKGILMRKLTVLQLRVKPGRKIADTQIRKE
ncbi:uncharacterized mitochondrial protein-like protein [Tanacetum coccineum]